MQHRAAYAAPLPGSDFFNGQQFDPRLLAVRFEMQSLIDLNNHGLADLRDRLPVSVSSGHVDEHGDVMTNASGNDERMPQRVQVPNFPVEPQKDRAR